MKVLLAFATVAAIASSHGQRHQQDSQRLQQDNQRQNDDNQGQQDQKQGEGLLDGPDFHGLCKEFVPCQRAEKFFASPLRQDSGCPRASDLEPEFGFEESEDCTSDGDQIQETYCLGCINEVGTFSRDANKATLQGACVPSVLGDFRPSFDECSFA